MGKCTLALLSPVSIRANHNKTGRWGVILDAGSSGTRVHVYKWLNVAKARSEAKASPGDMFDLPKLVSKKHYTKKIRPGVSTFGDHPEDVGPDHLKGLLEHALDIVPPDQVTDTPIFLMATAGVRLLEPMKQAALRKEICAYAQQNTKFKLPDCDLHIQVIPGETEGLYGWIAANYLLGGFDNPEQHQHGNGHHTYGFLDMGGASAQIAFAPNTTEATKHADDLKLVRMRTLNGDTVEYKVFSSTWLGFGMNQARHRYVDALLESSSTGSVRELPDPCLPSGLKTSLVGEIVEEQSGKDPILLGTGKFKECLAQTYPLLDKDAPCENAPCLLHGQHVPAIDFNVNHFVGVSEYWHTTHEVFEMAHKDTAYDFASYQKMVMDFCSETWDDIAENVEDKKWGKKVDLQTAQEVCFKASWLINVLHDGIGVPRIGLEKSTSAFKNATKHNAAHGKDRGFLDPFQAVDKVDGTEVSWTLGKMLLYAAGQIPPANKAALEVGFGNNVGPANFQKAGSSPEPYPMDDDDTWSDLQEDIVDKAHNKFSSAFFIFILLIVLIGYIFRKRDRRLRLYRGLNNTLRRNRRPGSPKTKGKPSFFSTGKLWGRQSQHYERVLEDGEGANEFELQDVDSSDENEASDSSEGSRIGRTSGLATPKMNVMFNDPNTYFEGPPHSNGQSGGHGLNQSSTPLPPQAFNRSGLVVRTESRERLAPGVQLLGAGRRSRAGSPTRKTSPLMAPLEED